MDVAALLDSGDGKERERALAQIAFGGYTEHLERVTQLMLSDPLEEVRERAAWALDNLNDSRSLPALLKGIHDPTFEVRSAAGWALVHLGERVRPHIQKILDSSDSHEATEMAQLVLERL